MTKYLWRLALVYFFKFRVNIDAMFAYRCYECFCILSISIIVALRDVACAQDIQLIFSHVQFLFFLYIISSIVLWQRISEFEKLN